jgi:ribosomal protein S18 acetylase RimI-like enzyme
MNDVHFTAVISRVAEKQWHALEDDRVVGRGEASHRPDGRIFLSVDAWHGAAFDRLAEVMLADLPRPLYTMVDEADEDLTAQWERAGFVIRRREWDYLVSTDPQVTGLGSVLPPPGVTIVGVGRAAEAPLRRVDRAIRDEVEAAVGWREMPAEIFPYPMDPSRYAVAEQADDYVGLIRIGPVIRRPRIGLIAVRAGVRRRGIARSLLANVLGALHRTGFEVASAEVNESNGPATALFESIGARRAGSTLELVAP